MKKRRTSATPGGKTKLNTKDVYKLKTADGYKTAAEIVSGSAKSFAAQSSLNAIMSGNAEEGFATGTSIFDPVLCELVYRWFCPEGGQVLDPFAGGSVRGVVASKLGLAYTGIDLSERQVEANRRQGAVICDPENQPSWIVGNSLDIETLAEGVTADLVFSCPPYFDLETYSENPEDLSTMDYDQFLEVYRGIIMSCCRMLKDNRFAVFTVGDVRDERGIYRGLPWHTVKAFQDAGLGLYNECALVTSVGSLPVRITRQFEAARKLGKTHQNVLMFVKGDPRIATQAIGNERG